MKKIRGTSEYRAQERERAALLEIHFEISSVNVENDSLLVAHCIK